MKPFLKKYRFAYLILLIFLLGFIFLFMTAWPNRELQRYIAVGFGFCYFFWGVFTHIKAKRINTEIVFEYLAISLLAVLMTVLVTV